MSESRSEDRGGQPDATVAREARRLLVIAQDSGEPVSFAALREELAVSGPELTSVLDDLRKRGMATEVAPGEWQASEEEEPVSPAAEPEAEERVRVHLPDASDREDAPDAFELEELAHAGLVGGARIGQVSGEPTVRLTMAIARALDAAALGALVKAAIEGLEEGEWFVLEVTP